MVLDIKPNSSSESVTQQQKTTPKIKMMLKLLVVVMALAGSSLGRPEDFQTKIDSKLLKYLQNKATTVNIFVSFKEGAKKVLEAITDTRFPSREDRLNAMHLALVENAEKTQSAAIQSLLGQKEFTSFWISNELYVKDCTLTDVYNLAGLEEVGGIREEELILLDDPTPTSPIVKRAANAEAEWGVLKLQAPEAHALLNSTLAKVNAVRVCTIDSGARYTHEALRDNFLGEYGWFDPGRATEEPNDQNGHGTHTTGTICGSKGIGVYPDAKWQSCKGCASSSCSQSDLLACGQWTVCPTLPDGTNADCTKAPHLVSNSWGGGRGNAWYDPVIEAWHAAGVLVLFSIGNSGPSCNTANSPGDRNVIGVGSTTVDDAISSFSSVGPSIDGKMKPEISAPGSNVLSAYNTADDDYRSLSGTSMACPHAAGLTAILLAHTPDLTHDKILKTLNDGVETEPLQTSGRVCEGIPDNQFPNHVFGSGRINALLSLKAQIAAQK